MLSAAEQMTHWVRYLFAALFVELRELGSKLEKEFLSSSSRHALPGSLERRPNNVHLMPVPPAAPKPQGCVYSLCACVCVDKRSFLNAVGYGMLIGMKINLYNVAGTTFLKWFTAL